MWFISNCCEWLRAAAAAATAAAARPGGGGGSSRPCRQVLTISSPKNEPNCSTFCNGGGRKELSWARLLLPETTAGGPTSGPMADGDGVTLGLRLETKLLLMLLMLLLLLLLAAVVLIAAGVLMLMLLVLTALPLWLLLLLLLLLTGRRSLLALQALLA